MPVGIHDPKNVRCVVLGTVGITPKQLTEVANKESANGYSLIQVFLNYPTNEYWAWFEQVVTPNP